MIFPDVSVVMAVFNGKDYIGRALEGLLAQTLSTIEVIVIDDASTDETLVIIESFSDPRLKLLKNETNLGLTKSLNLGISFARGKNIARQDADDYSFPNRLWEQKIYMDSNPDVGVCGCLSTGTCNLNSKIKSSSQLMADLLYDNIMIHSSIMIRREILIGLAVPYNPDFIYAQDYELLARLAFKTKIAVIPRALVEYGIHENNISKTKRLEQKKFADMVRVELFSKIFNRGLTNLEIDIIQLNFENISIDNLAHFVSSVLKSNVLYRSGELIQVLRRFFFKRYNLSPSKKIGLRVLMNPVFSWRQKIYLLRKSFLKKI
jgi:glycosyltransferase involved in cell wall biosynthesis